jgi:hypothetical protein
MSLVEAFNVMRKAAENSHGTLAYHQNLQSAIEVIAQLVIKESKNTESKNTELQQKQSIKED